MIGRTLKGPPQVIAEGGNVFRSACLERESRISGLEIRLLSG
jgi:hypothetical protein